jgi:hypothetical protein
MQQWKVVGAALGGAGAIGAALALSSGAGAASTAMTLYTGTLYGNIPNITVRTVPAAGAPWIVKGTVTITSTMIVAKGTDLVIPAGYLANGKAVPKNIINTTGGAPSVGAELTCAQGGTPVITATAPLSKTGAFDISSMAKVPATCTNPIVLIGPESKGKLTSWWASTNFLTYGLPGKSTLGWTKASGSGGSSSSWG